MRLLILCMIFCMITTTGCTSGSISRSANISEWQTADPYKTGTDGSLTLTKLNEGSESAIIDSVTGLGTGSLNPGNTYPDLTAKSENGITNSSTNFDNTLPVDNGL